MKFKFDAWKFFLTEFRQESDKIAHEELDYKPESTEILQLFKEHELTTMTSFEIMSTLLVSKNTIKDMINDLEERKLIKVKKTSEGEVVVVSLSRHGTSYLNYLK